VGIGVTVRAARSAWASEPKTLAGYESPFAKVTVTFIVLAITWSLVTMTN